MALDYAETIKVVVVEKLVIAGIIIVVGGAVAYAFNRYLEAAKANHQSNLEIYKTQSQAQLEAWRASNQAHLDLWKSEQSRVLESTKDILARQQELDRSIRTATADVARLLARGNQSIAWLSWYARYSPSDLNESRFQAYNDEMRADFAALVAARVVLAALSAADHDGLAPFIKRLYKNDQKVSHAENAFRRDMDACTSALTEVHKETILFDNDLLAAVSLRSQKTPQTLPDSGAV